MLQLKIVHLQVISKLKCNTVDDGYSQVMKCYWFLFWFYFKSTEAKQTFGKEVGVAEAQSKDEIID